MINVTPQIRTALAQTGLKVYNENFLKNESVPCISYYEYDNNIDENSDIIFSFSFPKITLSMKEVCTWTSLIY